MRGRLRPAAPADGRVAGEAAEQHPPTLRPRLPQQRQDPTEIGRIAHRPFERAEKPLKLGEIVGRVAAHIGDVDVPRRAGNRLDVRSFVGVGAVWERTGKPAPRHAGERDQPLVFLGERAGGKDRDRRGVEPAAEQAADRMDAAHLPAQRQIKTRAQPVGVGLIGRTSDRLDLGRRPVPALRCRTVGLHPHDMRGRHAKDVAVDGCLMVRVIEHEEIGEFFFAQFARHAG